MIKMIGVFMFAAIIVFLVLNNWKSDAVSVYGWEHGTAVCGHMDGPRKNWPYMKEDDFTMWTDKGAMYVINWGHENDPEVRELEIVAKLVCLERE